MYNEGKAPDLWGFEQATKTYINPDTGRVSARNDDEDEFINRNVSDSIGYMQKLYDSGALPVAPSGYNASEEDVVKDISKQLFGVDVDDEYLGFSSIQDAEIAKRPVKGRSEFVNLFHTALNDPEQPTVLIPHWNEEKGEWRVGETIPIDEGFTNYDYARQQFLNGIRAGLGVRVESPYKKGIDAKVGVMQNLVGKVGGKAGEKLSQNLDKIKEASDKAWSYDDSRFHRLKPNTHYQALRDRPLEEGELEFYNRYGDVNNYDARQELYDAGSVYGEFAKMDARRRDVPVVPIAENGEIKYLKADPDSLRAYDKRSQKEGLDVKGVTTLITKGVEMNNGEVFPIRLSFQVIHGEEDETIKKILAKGEQTGGIISQKEANELGWDDQSIYEKLQEVSNVREMRVADYRDEMARKGDIGIGEYFGLSKTYTGKTLTEQNENASVGRQILNFFNAKLNPIGSHLTEGGSAVARLFGGDKQGAENLRKQGGLTTWQQIQTGIYTDDIDTQIAMLQERALNEAKVAQEIGERGTTFWAEAAMATIDSTRLAGEMAIVNTLVPGAGAATKIGKVAHAAGGAAAFSAAYADEKYKNNVANLYSYNPATDSLKLSKKGMESTEALLKAFASGALEYLGEMFTVQALSALGKGALKAVGAKSVLKPSQAMHIAEDVARGSGHTTAAQIARKIVSNPNPGVVSKIKQLTGRDLSLAGVIHESWTEEAVPGAIGAFFNLDNQGEGGLGDAWNAIVEATKMAPQMAVSVAVQGAGTNMLARGAVGLYNTGVSKKDMIKALEGLGYSKEQLKGMSKEELNDYFYEKMSKVKLDSLYSEESLNKKSDAELDDLLNRYGAVADGVDTSVLSREQKLAMLRNYISQAGGNVLMDGAIHDINRAVTRAVMAGQDHDSVLRALDVDILDTGNSLQNWLHFNETDRETVQQIALLRSLAGSRLYHNNIFGLFCNMQANALEKELSADAYRSLKEFESNYTNSDVDFHNPNGEGRAASTFAFDTSKISRPEKGKKAVYTDSDSGIEIQVEHTVGGWAYRVVPTEKSGYNEFDMALAKMGMKPRQMKLPHGEKTFFGSIQEAVDFANKLSSWHNTATMRLVNKATLAQRAFEHFRGEGANVVVVDNYASMDEADQTIMFNEVVGETVSEARPNGDITSAFNMMEQADGWTSPDGRTFLFVDNLEDVYQIELLARHEATHQGLLEAFALDTELRNNAMMELGKTGKLPKEFFDVDLSDPREVEERLADLAEVMHKEPGLWETIKGAFQRASLNNAELGKAISEGNIQKILFRAFNARFTMGENAGFQGGESQQETEASTEEKQQTSQESATGSTESTDAGFNPMNAEGDAKRKSNIPEVPVEEEEEAPKPKKAPVKEETSTTTYDVTSEEYFNPNEGESLEDYDARVNEVIREKMLDEVSQYSNEEAKARYNARIKHLMDLKYKHFGQQQSYSKEDATTSTTDDKGTQSKNKEEAPKQEAPKQEAPKQEAPKQEPKIQPVKETPVQEESDSVKFTKKIKASAPEKPLEESKTPHRDWSKMTPGEIIQDERFVKEEVPVEEIVINNRIKQFKRGANPKTGVVEGKRLNNYSPSLTHPIRIFEYEEQNEDGTTRTVREVITGRHRLESAKRSGFNTITSIVYRESDGMTVEKARSIDALENIHEGKGSGKDFLTFFGDIRRNRDELTAQRSKEKDATKIKELDAKIAEVEKSFDDLTLLGIKNTENRLVRNSLQIATKGTPRLYSYAMDDQYNSYIHAFGAAAQFEPDIQEKLLDHIIQTKTKDQTAIEFMGNRLKARMEEFEGEQGGFDFGFDETEQALSLGVADLVKETTKLRQRLNSAITNNDTVELKDSVAKKYGITDKSDMNQLNRAVDKLSQEVIELQSPTISGARKDEAIARGMAILSKQKSKPQQQEMFDLSGNVKEESKPVETKPATKVEKPKAEKVEPQAPKVEKPKAEKPKVETPKAEKPKAEKPKTETPKKETPKQEVAPQVSAPTPTFSGEITKELKDAGDELMGLMDELFSDGDTQVDTEGRFRIRTKPAPKKTFKAYKLMRLNEDGSLSWLFIDKAQRVAMGTWNDAESPDLSVFENLERGYTYLVHKDGKAEKMHHSKKPTKTEILKATDIGARYFYVDSYSDGSLSVHNWGLNTGNNVASYALRPGIHATNAPSATHIGAQQTLEDGTRKPYRSANEVWVEVEIAADVDYNEEALQNAPIIKDGKNKGKPNAQKAQILHIPEDGYYNYRTNSNANPNQLWHIAGSIKLNRILSDKEVEQRNLEMGITPDLARIEPRVDSPDYKKPEAKSRKNAKPQGRFRTRDKSVSFDMLPVEAQSRIYQAGAKFAKAYIATAKNPSYEDFLNSLAAISQSKGSEMFDRFSEVSYGFWAQQSFMDKRFQPVSPSEAHAAITKVKNTVFPPTQGNGIIKTESEGQNVHIDGGLSSSQNSRGGNRLGIQNVPGTRGVSSGTSRGDDQKSSSGRTGGHGSGRGSVLPTRLANEQPSSTSGNVSTGDDGRNDTGSVATKRDAQGSQDGRGAGVREPVRDNATLQTNASSGQRSSDQSQGDSVDTRGQSSTGKPQVSPDEKTHNLKPQNYIIPEDGGGIGKAKSNKARARANIRALQIVKQLEEEGRFATEEEQREMSLYSGWGNLSQVFDEANEDFTEEFNELKNLLTEDEYNGARRSTQYAHYTPIQTIRGVYAALEHIGLKNEKDARAFEAGTGIGHFIGALPAGLYSASYAGVEVDPISHKIAKHLYPNADLRLMGYQNYRVSPTNDFVIGNPPFSSTTLHDPTSKAYNGMSMHNHFIAKQIDSLRPGGVGAFVVTHNFLDAKNQSTREYINKKAKFLGYIRLPSSTFKDIANTNIVCDIVFFRKLMPNEKHEEDAEWVKSTTIPAAYHAYQTKKGTDSISINLHVANNRAGLGGHNISLESDQFGKPRLFIEGDPLNMDDIRSFAQEILPSNVYVSRAELAKVEKNSPENNPNQDELIDGKPIPNDIRHPSLLAGGYYIDENGNLCVSRQGIGDELLGKPCKEYNKAKEEADHIARNKGNAKPRKFDRWRDTPNASSKFTPKEMETIKAAVKLRNIRFDLVTLELSPDAKEETIEAKRKELNEAYDDFRKVSGKFLNSTSIRKLLFADPAVSQIQGLEKDYQPQTNVIETINNPNRKSDSDPETIEKKVTVSESAKKSDIFFKRVNTPSVTLPTHYDDVGDALNVSVNTFGRVDMEWMKDVTGKTEDKIVADLKGRVFKDIETGEFVSREVYLSGDVKTKLKKALYYKEANPQDPSVDMNIEELKKVIPEDIPTADISIPFGSPFVDVAIYKLFLKTEIGFTSTQDLFLMIDRNGNWDFKVKSPESKKAALSKYPYPKSKIEEGVEKALNNKTANITTTLEDGKKVTNVKETELANNIISSIRDKWEAWWPSNTEISKILAERYNDIYNRTAEAKYDGSVLKFEGINVNLHPHQKNAVLRTILTRRVLFNHVVGAGKTLATVASVMEMKRMGIINKPIIVVPNHLTLSWRDEFLKAYPSANVLAAAPEDFNAINRKRFFSRIQNGSYDAIVIPHSQLGKLSLSPNVIETLMKRELISLRVAILEAKAAGNKRNVKNIEDSIQKLEERMKKKIEAAKADGIGIYLDTLGVDAFVLDESHEFKNVPFSSSINVAGMGAPKGSVKAFDLLMKMRYFQKYRPSSPVMFLTGTPIANSLTELYLNMKLIAPDLLERMGVSSMDSFLKTFGDITTDFELDATNRMKEKRRLRQLINVGEIMTVVREYMDVVDSDDVEARVPTLTGGKPINVVAKRSPEQANFFGEVVSRKEVGNGNIVEIWTPGSLAYRAESIATKKIDPKVDNMLKITSDGRAASLDIRLKVPKAPDFAGSKVNMAIDTIVDNYNKYNDVKGTQLVFCDLSIPGRERGSVKKALNEMIEKREKLQARAEKAEESGDLLDDIFVSVKKEDGSSDEMAIYDAIDYYDEAIEQAEEDLNYAHSVYDDVKAKLIAKGIPANEIAFIHSAHTDRQKSHLFAEVNSGKVRILMGSTAKMGAGTNVQERIVALHHLDTPWRPADMTQRNGRAIRQGNKLLDQIKDFSVSIYQYATEQTADAYKYQTLESKSKAFDAIYKADHTVRQIEDFGDGAMSAEEMKAAASGSTLMLKRVDIEKKAKKLDRDSRVFYDKRNNIEEEFETFVFLANREEQKIQRLTDFKAQVTEKPQTVEEVVETKEVAPGEEKKEDSKDKKKKEKKSQYEGISVKAFEESLSTPPSEDELRKYKTDSERQKANVPSILDTILSAGIVTDTGLKTTSNLAPVPISISYRGVVWIPFKDTLSAKIMFNAYEKLVDDIRAYPQNKVRLFAQTTPMGATDTLFNEDGTKRASDDSRIIQRLDNVIDNIDRNIELSEKEFILRRKEADLYKSQLEKMPKEFPQADELYKAKIERQDIFDCVTHGRKNAEEARDYLREFKYKGKKLPDYDWLKDDKESESQGRLRTKTEDAAYKRAVEEGDTERAMKMVREAAAKAMPNTKVVDEDGLPKVVYHGTTRFGFTQFKGRTFLASNLSLASEFAGDASERDIATALKLPENGWENRAALFKWLEDHNISYRLYTAYDTTRLELSTPRSLPNYDYEGHALYNDTSDVIIPDDENANVPVDYENPIWSLKFALGKGLGEWSNAHGDKGIYSVFVDIQNPYVLDAKGKQYYELRDDNLASGEDLTAQDVVELALRNPQYDGVVIENLYEGSGERKTTDYIPRDNSQIKSADPATYDDDGNLIPLSERFNLSKGDSRFRIRDKETEQERKVSLDEYIKARKDARPQSTPRKIINNVKDFVKTRDGESRAEYVARRSKETIDWLNEAFHDYLTPIRNLQKEVAGENIPEEFDIAKAAQLSFGRVHASHMAIEQMYIEPIRELLAKYDIELEVLDTYLTAMFAPERNAMIEERTKYGRGPANELGAGISNENAEELIKEIRNRLTKKQFAALETAASKIWELNRKTVSDLQSSGIISTDTAAAWLEGSPHYVPLRDDLDRLGLREDAKTNTLGKPFQSAVGRFTKTIDSQFAFSLLQAQVCVMLAEQNRINQTALAFCANYEAPLDADGNPQWYVSRGPKRAKRLVLERKGFRMNDAMPLNLNDPAEAEQATAFAKLDYTIKRDADSPDIVWVDPFEKDPTQKVKNMKDAGATHKPHNVMVRVDGHPMYIFFNNNEGTLGHRTGLAINKANLVDPHGKLFQGMKWLVHLKASLVTRFNPSFILRNMIMDANNAFGLLATEGKIKDAKAFVKNYRPALAAVARWKRTGKFGNKTRADQLLEEAVYTGVLTGTYTNSTYSDNLINEIIKPIKRLQIQKGFGPKGSALDTFSYLGERTFELIGALSDIPEVGVRLATYMALRDNGWSKSDAAVYAREITVDFNKKGRYGPVFNTLYMFFNAGFQSAVRWLKAFKRGGVKQVAKAIAVYMLIGFLSAWMNDDDDDWKNITDWEKQKSIIIPLPGDNYIRIPNRGVQSIFTYAGMKFYDMLNGYDTVSSGLMDVLGGPGLDAFSVLGEGSGDLLQAVLPTAFDPIAQHATNTAYHGGTIYTQKFPNQTTPDSHMGRQNTNSAAVWIAQMLNALTGGDEVEEGGIDIYPETISHYVQFLFGGLGTEIAKLGDFAIDATQGEFSVKNIPVLSGVLNEVPNAERRYYEAASDFSDAYTKYRKYRELGNVQKASEVAKENVILKETNRLYALRQRVEKLRRLVKDAKKQGQEDLAEKYEKQMLELEEAFLKVYEGIKSK